MGTKNNSMYGTKRFLKVIEYIIFNRQNVRELLLYTLKKSILYVLNTKQNSINISSPNDSDPKISNASAEKSSK